MADPEMTNPQKGTEPDYQIDRPKPKMTRQQRLGMGALLAGASLAALWTVWPSGHAERLRQRGRPRLKSEGHEASDEEYIATVLFRPR